MRRSQDYLILAISGARCKPKMPKITKIESTESTESTEMTKLEMGGGPMLPEMLNPRAKLRSEWATKLQELHRYDGAVLQNLEKLFFVQICVDGCQ